MAQFALFHTIKQTLEAPIKVDRPSLATRHPGKLLIGCDDCSLPRSRIVTNIRLFSAILWDVAN